MRLSTDAYTIIDSQNTFIGDILPEVRIKYKHFVCPKNDIGDKECGCP